MPSCMPRQIPNTTAKSVRVYNEIRPPLRGDHLTLEAAHSKKGEMKRRGKNYYTAKVATGGSKTSRTFRFLLAAFERVSLRCTEGFFL
jgi:hypothetical protein